jgi:hypothetical protein
VRYFLILLLDPYNIFLSERLKSEKTTTQSTRKRKRAEPNKPLKLHCTNTVSSTRPSLLLRMVYVWLDASSDSVPGPGTSIAPMLTMETALEREVGIDKRRHKSRAPKTLMVPIFCARKSVLTNFSRDRLSSATYVEELSTCLVYLTVIHFIIYLILSLYFIMPSNLFALLRKDILSPFTFLRF